MTTEETKPLEREPTKPDLFWACEYPACACECGHIAGKCEYCHWIGAVFCRCPFVCESTGKLRAGDICPVHGPKPVEREAFDEFLDELEAANPAGVDDVLVRASKYVWDAALERASRLAEEVAKEVGGKFADTHQLNTGLNKFIVRLRRVERKPLMSKPRSRWYQFWRSKCQHDWRPAHVRFYPVRVCDDCERQERITEEDFYAPFGISFAAICGQINEACRRLRREKECQKGK